MEPARAHFERDDLRAAAERKADLLLGPHGILEPTLHFARAVVRLPSLPPGICAMTSPPRLSMTRLNTADFATGPLSR